MKKIFVSIGLAASAAGLSSVFAQGMESATPKLWNVSGTLRGFYDDNYNYLTSLYQGDMVAAGGTTDAQGNPTNVAVEQRYDDTLSVARIAQIRSATHVVYRVVGDTNGYSGTEVVAGKSCGLDIQIVGDLQINISKLF